MALNLVSTVRDLQRRKGRKRRGLSVAEGVRLVEEALAAGVPFRGVLADAALRQSPRGAVLLEELANHAVPIQEVTERELRDLADTDSPQGVLAVIEPPRWTLEQIDPKPGQAVLVIDAVQDPGNVGTLLRTAFALGAAGTILLKGTADLANPKVMRGGMGATFRLPAATAEEGEFAKWVAGHDVVVWAAAEQGSPLERLAPPHRLALVMGNEGAGVRDAVRALAAQTVAIPLARGADSLNVAVAAGIILYDIQHRA